MISFLSFAKDDENALSVFHAALLLPESTRHEQTMFWQGLAKVTNAVTNDVLQEPITSLQAPDKWKEIHRAAQLRNLLQSAERFFRKRLRRQVRNIVILISSDSSDQ